MSEAEPTGELFEGFRKRHLLGYGTDVTPEFEAIAQAERLPDGTVHFETVILDKRDREYGKGETK